MYSDINLTNAPRRVPKGWTQIKCKLNVKQHHFRIIQLQPVRIPKLRKQL